MQIKTKIASCYAADSKPAKQEVNGTVILPPLVFPVSTNIGSNLGHYRWLQGHLLLQHRLPMDRRQRDAPGGIRLQNGHQSTIQGYILSHLYNNDFTSIIDIYFYETISTLTQNNYRLRFTL